MHTPYTPAPWVHVPRNRDGHADIITYHGRPFIQVGVPFAESPVLDYPHENFQTANARLIAAAPDLLAALQRLSFAALCRDSTSGDLCRLLEVKAELDAANTQAAAAIAKATQP